MERLRESGFGWSCGIHKVIRTRETLPQDRDRARYRYRPTMRRTVRDPADDDAGRTTPSPSPSPTSPSPSSSAASPVRLQDAQGREVEGWAVRRDLVVARCAGLQTPVTIIIGSRKAVSVAVYERTIEADDGQAWTAAVLPEGTLPLEGELFPPDFDRLARSVMPLRTDLTVHRSEAPAQVTRSIWCLLFPRARGC